jgi:hypothetical protein
MVYIRKTESGFPMNSRYLLQGLVILVIGILLDVVAFLIDGRIISSYPIFATGFAVSIVGVSWILWAMTKASSETNDNELS